MAKRKSIRQLIREIEATGHRVERAGNGHYRVLQEDGEIARDERGVPVQIPFSPRHDQGRSGALWKKLSRLGIIQAGR